MPVVLLTSKKLNRLEETVFWQKDAKGHFIFLFFDSDKPIFLILVISYQFSSRSVNWVYITVKNRLDFYKMNKSSRRKNITPAIYEDRIYIYM